MFTFSHIAQSVGQRIRIEGFVRATRIQSKMAFVVLYSGEHCVQAVCRGDAREAIKAFSTHSYVALTADVVASAQAPGGIELVVLEASQVELISKATLWPIAPESDIGAKLEWPAARFRERKEALTQIAQSQLEFQMMAYLQAGGFMALHSPKLIGAPSESGSEVFEVKYFGQKAYLAQSPQFYKQMAIIAGMGKIYESAPVFRAEPSFSSRHATEFVSFDVELEGVTHEEELIALECAMIRHAMQATLAAMGPELLAHYPQAVVPGLERVMTFLEAQTALGISGEESLTAEQERTLGAMLSKEGFDLVALTQVPWKQRPFYHHKAGEKLTRSFELLYRGVEITTGAVREHRYDVLMAQLEEKGLTGKGMEFYLDSFKLGAPKHGGFGLGLARLTMLFLALPGIKETTFIHRGPSRITP